MFCERQNATEDVHRGKFQTTKQKECAIREVLQHVILAKKAYERRLRGAAPVLYVILVHNHINSGLATVSRHS